VFTDVPPSLPHVDVLLLCVRSPGRVGATLSVHRCASDVAAYRCVVAMSSIFSGTCGGGLECSSGVHIDVPPTLSHIDVLLLCLRSPGRVAAALSVRRCASDVAAYRCVVAMPSIFSRTCGGGLECSLGVHIDVLLLSL
jgi:hypothetical protein